MSVVYFHKPTSHIKILHKDQPTVKKESGAIEFPNIPTTSVVSYCHIYIVIFIKTCFGASTFCPIQVKWSVCTTQPVCRTWKLHLERRHAERRPLIYSCYRWTDVLTGSSSCTYNQILQTAIDISGFLTEKVKTFTSHSTTKKQVPAGHANVMKSSRVNA